MSDLKDALERLREDVSGVSLAPAAEVRRDANRRRIAGWAAVSAATVLVAAAVVVPSALLVGSGGSGEPAVGVTPTPPVPSSASSGPSPEQAWLPDPWRVDSAARTSLSAAATAGDEFCGLAEVVDSKGELTAVRQTLSDDATLVRVYAIVTPGFGQASSLFKRIHAECAERGPVSDEEGPAMYWTDADGTPGAALWDNTTIYLVASGRPDTDLRDVVAGLIATVGRPCDDTMAGTACPPTQN